MVQRTGTRAASLPLLACIILSCLVTRLSTERSENDSNPSAVPEEDRTSGETVVQVQSSVSRDEPAPADTRPVLKDAIFAEALSQNSGISHGLAETGQPVLVTLVDTAAAELTEKIHNANSVDTLKNINNLSQFKDHGNQTPTVIRLPVEEVAVDATVEYKVQADSPALNNNETASKESSNATVEEEIISNATYVQEQIMEKNDTLDESTGDNKVQEDIPSFSEWTQKQLEEAEKNKENGLNLSVPSVTGLVTSPLNIKVRSKNYASPECGAKVVATNPEAGSASFILNSNRDEYMLNTCNSRIWFVVELCEAIQVKKFDIANFELFSSTPKNFSIFIGDRFPTREWASIGQFIAKDERDVQTFNLQSNQFGKFIKVELYSHHGSEHYCPISLFRVYGTSEFEVFETENNPHSEGAHGGINEDDDILEEAFTDLQKQQDSNLFGSARDAVMSIVKKAAQVLVKNGDSSNKTTNNELNEISSRNCITPSHIIVCDSCSNTLFSSVYETMSCQSKIIENLVTISSVYKAFHNTDVCQSYGLDFKSSQTSIQDTKLANYMSALLTPTYVVALCNMLAIIEKKVVLNTSYETDLNITSNLTIDKKIQNIKSEEDLMQNIIQVKPASNENIPDMESLIKSDFHGEQKNILSTTISSEEVEQHSIKPTKVVREETKVIEHDVISVATSYENPKVENIEPQTPEVKLSEMEISSTIDPSVTFAPSSEIDISSIPETESLSVINGEITDSQYPKPDTSETVIEQPGETNSLVNEAMEDSNRVDSPDLENLLSEFDQVSNDAATPPPAQQNIVSPSSQNQKESVFLRLSNRIKALERNMSLSSQYLEELSRRYKKQVEEMQKTFEKTLTIMKEESKRSEERDHKNREEMLILQQQLAELSSAVSVLLSEKDSWFGKYSLLNLFLLQLVIAVLVLYIYRKMNKQIRTASPERKVVINEEKVERIPIDTKPILISALKKHRRRSSDEAMHIVRSAGDSFDSTNIKSEKKKRRKKLAIINRSHSIASPSEIINLTNTNEDVKVDVRPEDGCPITDMPFVLEESEFIIPEEQPSNLDQLSDRKYPLNGVPVKQEKVNEKFRRLSSPAFLRDNFNRQIPVSSDSVDAKTLLSNSLYTPINKIFIKREVKSEEKPDRSGSESPQLSTCSSVGEISDAISSSENKKFNKKSKGKTFKNIFKNVLNK